MNKDRKEAATPLNLMLQFRALWEKSDRPLTKTGLANPAYQAWVDMALANAAASNLIELHKTKAGACSINRNSWSWASQLSSIPDEGFKALIELLEMQLEE